MNLAIMDDRRAAKAATPKSLQEKAMLVRLSISQWTARKYDKTVSEKVAEDFHADKEAGRYNKVLIAHGAIKRIYQIVNEVRTFHYEQTLPWEDDGARLLPAANYFNYSTKIRKYKRDYDDAVQDFIANYASFVEEAKVRLNGMFKAADYPSAEELPLKYAFTTTVNPLPLSTDFRVSIKDEEIQAIRAEIEMRMMKAQKDAMKDLWSRLYSAVDHMANKLSQSDAIFRDSLVENVRGIVDLLPRLNIADDAVLENLRKEVEQKLCRHSPDSLRTLPLDRAVAAKDAQEIVDMMSVYMGGLGK